MLCAHVADAARDHDRLVIAAYLIVRQARQLRFEGTEVAAQIRTTKFIIKRGAADGTLNHDFQRCRHAIRMRKINFPGLRVIWNP